VNNTNDDDLPPGWKPEIISVGDGDGSARIEELRRDPKVELISRIEDLRDELRNLLPAVDSTTLEEPTRWIYYPWRRTAVELLGPAGFDRLRLDRNRNKITSAEQSALRAMRIGVVGQSVGAVIAQSLVTEGLCGKLVLADFDVLELSNLNRVPATVLDIGLNKTVATARRLAELDPYVPIEIVPMGLVIDGTDEFVRGLDCVIEECDSLDVKLAVRESAQRVRIPVVMATSDLGQLDVERFDLDPDYQPFHGLLGSLTAAELGGLTAREKVPHILNIMEPDRLSARSAASMAEVDHTLTTWPQLHEDVSLSASTVAAVVRRLGLGQPVRSGRVRIDVGAGLDALARPNPGLVGSVGQPVVADREITAPADGVAATIFAAGRAPSGGNAQPWIFERTPAGIAFCLAPDRSVTIDLAFRGSYVAIGAALYNARVAAAAHRIGGRYELFPGPDKQHHIATLTFGDETDRALAEEWPLVLDRCTNRHLGTPADLEPSVKSELTDTVAGEGASLNLLTERATIRRCAELLAAADRLRYLTPTLHREMMSELRWPDHDDLDTGIDVRTLELDAADLARLTVARRSAVMALLAQWNAGGALGKPMYDSVVSSSAIAIISTRGGAPVDYVRTGMAVERLWIRAQARGLAVQPVSPIFLYARDRADIATLVGTPYRDELAQLAQQFRSLSAVPVDEELALVLRLSHAPRATVRSRRLPVGQLMRAQVAEPVDDG
jgi:molybdopterin/thiamine biosynthesis adenylyltransferase